MSLRHFFWPLALAAALAGCGGGSSPTAPPPTPNLHSLLAIVFYDRDGNGIIDPDEPTRLGSVTVEAGGQTAVTTSRTGQATVTQLPPGTHTVRIRADTLPAFFVPGQPVSVTVPQMGNALLAATLPIGSNRPSVFLTAGDSITVGDGSSDPRGYPGLLQDRLQMEHAVGLVVNEGIDSARSVDGRFRVGRMVDDHDPAYTLILFGTNDWNECKEASECTTQDNLREIVREVRSRDSLPFLATLPPPNTGFDERAPEQRAEWVEEMNEFIRTIAREEGAALVDLHGALTAAAGGDLNTVFGDHIHPNDAGYAVVADEFFRAITSPAQATAAAASFLAQSTSPAQPWFSPLAHPERGPLRASPLRAEELWQRQHAPEW